MLIQDLMLFLERVLKAIVKPEEFERFLPDIETEQTSVDRSASLLDAESLCLSFRRLITANAALA